MSALEREDRERLSSQLDRIRYLTVKGGKWWTLSGLREALRHGGVGASEAGISARLRELRAEGLTVERRKVHGARGLWEYRVTQPERAAEQEVLEFT